MPRRNNEVVLVFQNASFPHCLNSTQVRLQPNDNRLQMEEQHHTDFLAGRVHRKTLPNEAAYQMVRNNNAETKQDIQPTSEL